MPRCGGAATLSALDFCCAITGKNTPFLTKLFRSIRDDIAICAATGALLFVFYAVLPVAYGAYNIDVALFGIPFYLTAILRITQCARLEVVGRRLPRAISLGLLAFAVTVLVTSFVVAWKVALHRISPAASIWYQVSVLASSLFLFIESNRLLYFMKEKRIEPSPLILDLLSTSKFSSGLYKDIATMTPEWNRRTKEAERTLRASKKSKKMHRRKR